MSLITAAPGGGNWTAGATWVGGVAPTAADDALLTATSGNVTIDTGAVCRSLNCTGYVRTLTHTAAVTLIIGDGTAGASNIAFKLVAGMTYTLGNAATSAISFISTSATQQTIDFGGKNGALMTFNGAGGSWILSGDFITTQTSGSGINLLQGSLDTNGKTITVHGFSISGTLTRSLSLGASTINVSCNSGGLGAWTATTTTNLTFNCGTSSIICLFPNNTFASGGLTYYSVELITGQGTSSLTSAGTYTNLTFTLGASGRITMNANQTITGLLTMRQSSATSRGLLCSDVVGSARTLTAASASISNCHVMDIAGAGAAAPWATTNVGDMGGNSGMTFAAPVTRYWVATTGGNWSDTTSWSTSSGGASGASVPLPQDTAVFDGSSITSAGRTVTVNSQCIPSLDFANVTNSPTIAQAITNGQIMVSGSIRYKAGLTFSGTTTIYLSGRGSHTITSAGLSIPNTLRVDAYTGTYSLLDALICISTTNFSVNSGTFVSNNFSMTINGLSVTASIPPISVNLGTSTVSLTSTSAINIVDLRCTANITYSLSTCTLAITTASANQRVFNISVGTGPTLGDIVYTVAGSSGRLTIQQVDLSINNIYFSDATTARDLRFGAGATYTLRGNLYMRGSPGVVHTLSAVSTTNHILSKSSGIISLDYVTISDSTASGGAYFAAGNNSTDGGGGNTGWVFGAASFALSVADGVRVSDQKAVGTALSFNGTTARADKATTVVVTSAIGYAAWVKPAVVNINQRIVGLDNNSSMRITNAGKAMFTLFGIVEYPGTTTLAADQWYLISATYDKANIKVYVNGVLESTNAATNNFPANGTKIEIGSYLGFAQFNGIIDQPRIWVNRAPTQQEFMDLYTSGIVNRSNLYSEFMFDEGSGSTGNDTGSGANNVTITAATYTTDVPLVPDIIKAVAKNPADTINKTDAASKAFGINKADIVSKTDAVAKNMGVNKADTVNKTDATAKAFGKNLTETIVTGETIAKTFSRTITDTVTTADLLSKLFGKNISDPVSVLDSVGAAKIYPFGGPTIAVRIEDSMTVLRVN